MLLNLNLEKQQFKMASENWIGRLNRISIAKLNERIIGKNKNVQNKINVRMLIINDVYNSL